MKPLFLKLTVFTILWLAALSSEAQYRKLTHGQPFPYDTGVAIQISQYRIEGLYIKSSRAVIDSLNKESITLTREIDSLNTQVHLKTSLYNNQLTQTQTLQKSYDNLSVEVNTLSELFDEVVNKKDPWYKVAFMYLTYAFAAYGAGSVIFH